ncbi:MAG: T9SS type A sorting domain-containing protein [bacterium]|nr:T9SS type A sorting domain-containing protein [bacterium]
MQRFTLFIAIVCLANSTLFGQVTLTSGDATYTEDFNTLANTGTAVTWTDNTTLSGWYSDEIDYDASAGTSTSGALYSFGTGTDSDRALGSLASGGTGTVFYGVRILNNTGSTITEFNVSYTAEQWRQTTAAANTTAVSYQVGATDLTSGSWTSVTSLDIISLQAGTATGSLDGNDASNQSSHSATITTSVANGQEIWIRWVDSNDTGSDHGLAIDNFSITGCGTGEPTNHATSFASSSITNSTATLTWTDATGATVPNRYLIKGSTVSFADITDPTDASEESDSDLVKNIDAEIQTHSLEDLEPNTTYFFQIYPFTCTSPDYKTDGTIPQVSFTTDNYPVAWINEIHYDNNSTDVNEVIEIAVKDAGSYDLSLMTVELYNGSTTNSYDARTVSPDYTTGSTSGGITLYFFDYTAVGGIQNDTEGIALDYNGNLIQFLSYEGTFTATGGVADGVASTDIGVSESGSGSGTSMQLVGTGNSYDDFTWDGAVAASAGTANGSQVLPVELIEFTAKSGESGADLQWITASEIDNDGFEIQKSSNGTDFEVIGFVNGAGNSTEITSYKFIDTNFINEAFYRLKQIDFDGDWEFSPIIYLNDPKLFNQISVYPIPLTSDSKLELGGLSIENVNVQIFNLNGSQVFQTKHWSSETDLMNQLMTLESGLYIMDIQSGSNSKRIKLVR